MYNMYVYINISIFNIFKNKQEQIKTRLKSRWHFLLKFGTPPGSFNSEFTPEKIPGPNRKGSSSNHSSPTIFQGRAVKLKMVGLEDDPLLLGPVIFSGENSLLNLGGVVK